MMPPPTDLVCEHGTSMDVHCCHCHSGFIFDRDHECPSPRRVRPFAEIAWRTLALGIMLNLEDDWKWIAIKIGPLGFGVEWKSRND